MSAKNMNSCKLKGVGMIRSRNLGESLVVTIDRPEKANSLTSAMLQDLIDVLKAQGGASNSVILTGEGRVFSAGADLDEAKAGLATSPLWEELSKAIASLDCLTIATLNGTLAGGAFGMVLACDLRIAVPTANFFYPVMRLGFLPQPSDPGRMSALIGPARTKMILMAGQKIDAALAADWGLVDRIVEPDTLLDTALELASASNQARTDHVAAIKRLIV
jgi:enoyl-CoA hydratase/carnithine racemase